jgi:hypothetical protein
MAKRRSDAYRMRRAVGEAAQEHDGAYRCPMSMQVIAERHRVPLDELIILTAQEVEDRANIVPTQGVAEVSK